MPVSFSEAVPPFTVHRCGSLLTGAAKKRDIKNCALTFPVRAGSVLLMRV